MTLVYYYRQPQARLRSSDKLFIGDSASESAHAYVTTGESTPVENLTATFEGEEDGKPISAKVHAHRGKSRFVLTVDPANDGVVLRRMFDQRVSGQRAEVLVDDVSIGGWCTPVATQTMHGRDEDFVLPVAVTSKKSRITIEIRHSASDAAWSESSYEALSRIP